MTSARRLPILAVVLAFALTSAPAGAKSSKSAGGQKTVHVKEYTKKDGTTVAAHDRKAAASGGEAKAKQATPAPPAAPTVSRDERGRIQRSDAARHAFARQTGYPKGRPGYVIDHIVPLACGGADAPSNMQWQTVAEAKAKDKTERIGC